MVHVASPSPSRSGNLPPPLCPPPAAPPLPEGAGATLNVALSRALGPKETVKLPLTIGGTATRREDYRIVCIDAKPGRVRNLQ